MSYTDIAYCDSILTSEEWTNSTDPEKQNAIDMGELWINQAYDCLPVANPVPDNIQKANAYLADMYVKDELFAPVEGEIKSKSVSAGSVSSTKEYSGSSPSANPFAEIEILLSSECSINQSMYLQTVRV